MWPLLSKGVYSAVWRAHVVCARRHVAAAGRFAQAVVTLSHTGRGAETTKTMKAQSVHTFKGLACRARVTPARLPWWAHVTACVTETLLSTAGCVSFQNLWLSVLCMRSKAWLAARVSLR